MHIQRLDEAKCWLLLRTSCTLARSWPDKLPGFVLCSVSRIECHFTGRHAGLVTARLWIDLLATFRWLHSVQKSHTAQSSVSLLPVLVLGAA